MCIVHMHVYDCKSAVCGLVSYTLLSSLTSGEGEGCAIQGISHLPGDASYRERDALGFPTPSSAFPLKLLPDSTVYFCIALISTPVLSGPLLSCLKSNDPICNTARGWEASTSSPEA